jgi:hypothetical protein
VREADDFINFMCRMSWKYGSLNFLEPSGPHRAFYGTALPLPLFGSHMVYTFAYGPLVIHGAGNCSSMAFFSSFTVDVVAKVER